MTDGNTSQITNTHYNDGFQYTDNQLDFFPHAEGYVKVLDYSVFKYVYTYTDHLGNIRLKYTQDPGTGQTEILEENHYYPFGLTHKGYNHKHLIFWESPGTGIQLVPVTPDLTDTYKYKFGGKEWQDELDLNYYDFGARNYDAALVRTFTPDPMAEVYYELSPYSFLNNNPISNIDPTGAVTLSGQAAKDWLQNKKDEIASKPRKRKEKEDEENEIDDYFDEDTGEYLGRGGTDEIRFISRSDWKKNNLNSYKTYASSATVIAMFNFYYNHFGISKLFNQNVNAVFNSSNAWFQSPPLVNGKLIELVMNFDPSDIGRTINNRYDVYSIMLHELVSHGNDFLENIPYNYNNSESFWSWEKRATLKEINSPYWHKTSKPYKQWTYDSYGKHPYVLPINKRQQYFGRYGIKIN